MFGFLKIFKRKPVEMPAHDEAYEAVETEAYAEPEPMPVRAPAHPPQPQPMRPSRPVAAQPQPPSQNNGRGVQLPLQVILSGLPLELQPRVKQTDVGDATISVPLEKVLSQLSRGSVKISFGELRQAAPDVFAPGNDRDRVLVPLPLAEILSRLNPALITRRRVQKQVEVPDDISSPFDPQNQGAIFSVGPGKPEPAPAPAPPPPPAAPAARQPSVPPAMPVIPGPGRSAISSTPTPPPPTAMPPAAPVLTPAARVPREFASNAAPPPPPAQAPAAAVPAAVPVPNAGGEPLFVGLTSLADAWPEAVRQEIVQLNMVDAKVGLPMEVVERSLKQGRIAFSWKSLRAWVKPTPRPIVSAHDGVVLELPLKVVAPLFLARQREANKGQQQVAIDENIPNLFFGFPQGGPPAGPSAVAAATARPADTNYYVWDDSSDTVKVSEAEVKRGPSGGPSPGTTFVAKYATPNEVVSRAAGMDGVAGALIALPDGLMVASRLSPELNGDTLAAFLPQIFGKVSQCTKELRMGDLNNLNFTVGNVPWKIFRVNAIFFAAFGKPGEPLPTAKLAALAGELDHKPK
jgi:predicted regulator of Ras-like GTPase activity (Roadblock/LC7/MglB family)